MDSIGRTAGPGLIQTGFRQNPDRAMVLDAGEVFVNFDVDKFLANISSDTSKVEEHKFLHALVKFSYFTEDKQSVITYFAQNKSERVVSCREHIKIYSAKQLRNYIKDKYNVTLYMHPSLYDWIKL